MTTETVSRLDVVVELVRDLSSAVTPQQVLESYSRGIVKLNGPSGFISLSTRDLPAGDYRITRLLLEDNITDIRKADPWSQRDAIEVRRGGILGEIVRGGRPRIINDLRIDTDPVLGDRLSPYRSLMAMPLYDAGDLLNWGLALRRDAGAFSEQDLEDGVLRANLVGAAVRHTLTLGQLRSAKRRIDDEVARIASIQRALLPPRVPKFPGLDVAVYYETYEHAGGDLYDFHLMGTQAVPGASPFTPQPTGQFGMILADVSGHGPSAAVVMAMCSALLYAYPFADQSPVPVLSFLNRHLCSKRIEDTFVTALCASYDPATHEFTYACAGHPTPMVRSPGGNVESLERVGGLPLGILSDATYEQHVRRVPPGSLLALYTDGITEARPTHGSLLGEEGVREALTRCNGTASDLVRNMLEVVRRHENGTRPQDDQTFIALRVHED